MSSYSISKLLAIADRFINRQKKSLSCLGVIFFYGWQTTNIMPAIAISPFRRFVAIDLDPMSTENIAIAKPKLIAGADNFNPTLNLQPLRLHIPIIVPSPPPPPPPPSSQTAPSSSGKNSDLDPGQESSKDKPFAVLEEVEPNVYSTWNNSGQVNRIVEPTAILRLSNGDRLSIVTGYNTYEQAETKTVVNIPLGINWYTKINSLSVGAGAGVDVANGSTTPNFNLKVSYPLTSSFTVGAYLAQGAYKFNAKTIENQVTALRYGPSIVWQIDRDTSFFSSLHLGSYNDNNQETQLLSRIERKLGEFSVAGSVFNWNYQNPTDKGYFAPPDFLVYTGELAWEGSVFSDSLSCRIAVSLGEQRVNSKISDAGGYQTKCTAKLSPNLDASLGYSFSNVKDRDSGSSSANSQSITSQIRVKF
jgi:hypothetical protein